MNPIKTAFEIDRDALVQIFSRNELDEETAQIATGLQPKVYNFPVGPSLLR